LKESEFQSKILKSWKAGGAEVLNLHGHLMMAPGWPDLFVYHWDVHALIELKVGNNTLSGAQRLILKQLTARRVLASAWTLNKETEIITVESLRQSGDGVMRAFVGSLPLASVTVAGGHHAMIDILIDCARKLELRS